ncbi:MAG: TIGR02996 domain-containing protein [Archangium sp.]
MREHDYVALEAAARAGRLHEVNDALGVELSEESFRAIDSLSSRLRLGHGSFAIALALISRALREPGIAIERLTLSGRFVHRLAATWTTKNGERRLTLGMAETFDRRAIGNAWPLLNGWKTKLEHNRELAARWAADPNQPNRIELPVSAKLEVAAPRDADEEDGLLKAITAAPDDDGPRLVYADWLEERGDARGEFIRLQVQLARGGTNVELQRRVNTLLKTSWKNYAGELAKYVSYPKHRFVRGFPQTVAMTGAAFAKHGERFFSRWPIEHLVFDNRHFTPTQLEQLVTTPAMARVRELSLTQIVGSPKRAVAALARGARFDSLQTLNLTGCGANANDWEQLFTRLDAPKLRAISLIHVGAHPALFAALASNEKLPALRSIFEQRMTNFGRASAAEWRAAFTRLARLPLEELGLRGGGHPHDEATLRVFFERGSKCRFKRLSLASDQLTDSFVSVLVKSPSAATLESVELHRAGAVTLRGALALLRLPRLHTLELSAMYRPGTTKPSWTQEDREALLAAAEALPTDHPLHTLGLPFVSWNDQHETHARFNLR